MQPRLFEEWIGKGHQQNANLCGACARPADELPLVRGGLSLRAVPSRISKQKQKQVCTSHTECVNNL